VPSLYLHVGDEVAYGAADEAIRATVAPFLMTIPDVIAHNGRQG
jgi:hypothetical protein